MIFETGAKTAASNNLVLSVLNDGVAYETRKHIGYAMLQGSEHLGLTFRSLVETEAQKQRKQGCKFKAAEISEAAKLIQSTTITHCLECIFEQWDGENIIATGRRWWDKINGNSYFSVNVQIPQRDAYFRQVNIPFQGGYGNHWEWVSVGMLKKIGFTFSGNYHSEFPIVFRDEGYMNKKFMFSGMYI